MPPKTKKVSPKKTRKIGSSEEADTLFWILAPNCVSHGRDELDGPARPEGRNQGHSPRPFGAGR
jgi:hypothetical protein